MVPYKTGGRRRLRLFCKKEWCSDVMDLHMPEGYFPFQIERIYAGGISVTGFFYAAESLSYIDHNVPVGRDIKFQIAEGAFYEGVCHVIFQRSVSEVYFQIAERTFQEYPAYIAAHDIFYGVSKGGFITDFLPTQDLFHLFPGTAVILGIGGYWVIFIFPTLWKENIQPDGAEQGGAQYGPGSDHFQMQEFIIEDDQACQREQDLSEGPAKNTIR